MAHFMQWPNGALVNKEQREKADRMPCSIYLLFCDGIAFCIQ